MYQEGGYPLGARSDDNAPYNQPMIKPDEVEVDIVLTMSLHTKIKVDDFHSINVCFSDTFYGCTNMKTIPWATGVAYNGFFPNVTPAAYMFAYTFYGAGLETLSPVSTTSCSYSTQNGLPIATGCSHPFLSYMLVGGTNTADYMFFRI